MQQLNVREIENVIFDLGEVIVDLMPDRVINQLALHSSLHIDEIREAIVSHPALYAYETGKLSDQAFVVAMNASLAMDLTIAAFENIWNSLLGDIPSRKLLLMQALMKDYQVLILSNTNAMHQRGFDAFVYSEHHIKMSAFAHHAYYSHDIGFRKPDPQSYQYLIDNHHLNPTKTVFFDDKVENVTAAIDMGIIGVQIKSSDMIYEYLDVLIRR